MSRSVTMLALVLATVLVCASVSDAVDATRHKHRKHHNKVCIKIEHKQTHVYAYWCLQEGRQIS
jgi:hypothetical protein